MSADAGRSQLSCLACSSGPGTGLGRRACPPRAIQHPSAIQHPHRDETRGVVIHWTAGHKQGDLATLDGPNVDCHFYVDQAGDVFEFLDTDSQAWHAFHTANHTCLGIEHEGSGEAWTPKQLEASAQLTAWLSRLYNIPVAKVDP